MTTPTHQEMNKDYIWWFDETWLIHDPWLEWLCMVSWKKLNDWPRQTISLMSIDGKKSYFFRVSKYAREWLTDKQKCDYESSIIDRDVWSDLNE